MKRDPLQYRELVHMIVRRYSTVRPEQDAEEYGIAWIALIAACESYDNSCPFCPWAYNRMKWAILDDRRRWARRIKATTLKDEPAAREESSRQMAYRELSDEIEVALKRCGPLTRKLTRQHLFGQLPCAQVARSNRMTDDAVRGRVNVVKRHLRRRLAGWRDQ